MWEVMVGILAEKTIRERGEGAPAMRPIHHYTWSGWSQDKT
jgi:hypothetical protein